MNYVRSFDDEARREDASDWIVRLQAADLGEADALAFDAWLMADARNPAAYDAALAIWLEYARTASEVREDLAAPRRAAPTRRRFYLTAGAMAAAAAAVVVVLPGQDRAPAVGDYTTARGEHRTVNLADGSTIDLNAGTRLTVSLERGARRVVLEAGQAVFDVAADARRPFVIAVGDRTVQVVGTQFDVRRRDGQLAVTVARGAVEVRPTDGAGKAWRLHPGQRLEHREGAADVRITAAEPKDVLGWRSGRLVYRDRPLSEVVADLNQQFPTPIRIEDASLAQTPISGVLVLDDQDAVIGRLALLVPISAVRSDAGIVLRRESAPKR